jgi:hypothetical protein
MRVAHVPLVATCVLGGYAQAQMEERREERAVARLCRDDAQHLCSGKTGQALEQCLKSNQAQLSSTCKDKVSKLPGQPTEHPAELPSEQPK